MGGVVGRRKVMRKVLVLILGVLVVVPLGASGASAEPERYTSRSYNAFWFSRHRIDRDTYVRTTWYAGVYVSEETSGEADFWSDLYKSSARCERREGRDRCRRAGSNLYGVINDLGDGEFTLDAGLETGHFEATYPMERRDGRRAESIGKIAITVDLVAVGEVTTSRDSYSYSSGCYRVRYSGRSEYVQARARGALAFLRDDETIKLGATKAAGMSQGESMSIEHICDEE
jgi:hypothetical protein